MAIRKNDMEKLLGRAQLALENAKRQKEISERLKIYGYDKTRLDEGFDLYKKAKKLYREKEYKYGDLYETRALVGKARKELNEKYLFDLELARVVFKKEKGLLSKLDGIGNRKNTLSGWLKQVKVFYTNALAEDEILEKLKNFGLTGEKLTAGKEMADQLDQAVARREARRGEARRTTRERDQALAELSSWMGDFRRIARLALKDKPQLIEALGYIEPS